MRKDDKEKLIAALMANQKIIKMYEEYIVKSISFEKWVRHTTDNLLKKGNKPFNLNLPKI